jgi:hypothetical protein
VITVSSQFLDLGQSGIAGRYPVSFLPDLENRRLLGRALVNRPHRRWWVAQYASQLPWILILLAGNS